VVPKEAEVKITRMARARRWLVPNDEPLPRIALVMQRMARRILSKQPIYFTAEELRQAMKINLGLPPESIVK
jgi:hypothetical protein